jgi:DNA-binding response OmpR family regulator
LERWVFDSTDRGRARALDKHAEDTPGDGVSWKPSADRGPAGHLAAAGDPPEAAPSAIHRNPRILVADDSLLMADQICDSLQENGYSIVGPAGSVQAACALARAADFDGAVLDLKLGQDLCLPIATLLKARGIPFVILTGYPVRVDVPGFEPAAWIIKPMEAGELTEAIDRMLAQRAAGSGTEAAQPHQTFRHGRQAICTTESVFRSASKLLALVH